MRQKLFKPYSESQLRKPITPQPGPRDPMGTSDKGHQMPLWAVEEGHEQRTSLTGVVYEAGPIAQWLSSSAPLRQPQGLLVRILGPDTAPLVRPR